MGLALEDSLQAINEDDTYVKAYYRCGTSYLLLFKYDESK